jgi:hypothetical protein
MARPDHEQEGQHLLDDLKREKGITLSDGARIEQRHYTDNEANRAGRERGDAATFYRPVAGSSVRMIGSD